LFEYNTSRQHFTEMPKRPKSRQLFVFFASRVPQRVSNWGGLGKKWFQSGWFAAGAPESGWSLESDGDCHEETRFVSNGASNGIRFGHGR
jgi:hypothetical protein